MGARRQQWMPFWLPFLMAGKRFDENTSSSRIELIKHYFIVLYETKLKRPCLTPLEEVTCIGLGGSINLTP
jgi:hypothetical protein